LGVIKKSINQKLNKMKETESNLKNQLLFSRMNVAAKFAPIENIGGQMLIFYSGNGNINGMQIGNLTAGNVTTAELVRIQLPDTGIITIHGMGLCGNRLSTIDMTVDGQLYEIKAISPVVVEFQLYVELDVKFSGVQFDSGSLFGFQFDRVENK
jgi:hypothetical protein